MIYGLTERQVESLRALLREPSRDGRGEMRPRTYEDHHWLKLSSTTQTSSRYPGHFYTRDSSATMTQKDAVWVTFPNGITPDTSTYYYGRCSGFANSRPVFDVPDWDTSGGGGGSGFIPYGVYATSSTSLSSGASNLISLSTEYASHSNLSVSTSVITASADLGQRVVSCTCYVDASNGGTVTLSLQKDTGGGFSDVAGSTFAHVDNGDAFYADNHLYTIQSITDISSGDDLRFYAVCATGTTATVYDGRVIIQ